MSRTERYRFRLYVVGDAPNSMRAIANLKALCREHLAGDHDIEIIDVLLDGKRAIADRVFMTPTLVTLAPLTPRRIVGTLSQTDAVLQILGLPDGKP
jgi:circadian clock protein KaiB